MIDVPSFTQAAAAGRTGRRRRPRPQWPVSASSLLQPSRFAALPAVLFRVRTVTSLADIPRRQRITRTVSLARDQRPVRLVDKCDHWLVAAVGVPRWPTQRGRPTE